MFEQQAAEKKDSQVSLQTDEILPSVAAYTDETIRVGHKSSQARQIIDYSETSQRPASQQQTGAENERQTSSTVYQVSQQRIVTDRNQSQLNNDDRRQRQSHEFLVEPDQHRDRQETGDEEEGLETLKPSQKEDASLEGSGDETQIFIEKVIEQEWKRKDEQFSFEEHHKEAGELIKGTANMAEPADLVPNQFDLQNLIAEQSYERQGMAVMSCEQEARSAKQLIKADMRFLDNQQRQQYLRQQLKSQGVGQCRRQTFFNGRHSSLISAGQEESSSIYHESVPLNKSIQHRASSTNNGGKFNSLQVPQHLVEKADRCQTRDGTSFNKRSSNLKSVFAKQANATHHFFNQRKNNKRQSSQLGVHSSTDEFRQSINNNSQTATGTDQEGDYVLIGKDKVDVISGNRRSQAATMDSYSHKRSSRQTSSSLAQNGGAQGLTYPHVPFKTKVAQKSKLKQRQALKSQKSKEYSIAPFHQDQSHQMRYFDESSAKDLMGSVPMKATQKTTQVGSTRQFNKSQMKQTLMHLDQQSQMDSESSSNRLPLNRFNAAHEITVKPMPIYDSLNKTNVNFPSQQKSLQTLQSGGVSDFVNSSMLVKTKKDGPEQMIVKQAERDLLKLKEKLLQQALDKERRVVPPDADEQQKVNDLDFNESIENLKNLGQCFWRFVEVEPILTTVLNNFENLMEKKRVQLAHYVRQVQGQFVLISDRIAEQKVQFEKVSEHLNRQEAFRKKVFNRESSEVMALIEEYDRLDKIGNHEKLELPDYSELTTDLEYIQRQLENAQLNLDTLVVFADRDQPMNIGVINDMKEEKEQRVRDIQRLTAKRIVKRYYVNKDLNKHVAIQTDADQIAMFKDFYECQVDAMMDRELSLQKDLENQVHRYSMQQNKIELFERKIEELNDKIEVRDETIDEFAIKHRVVDEELTSKAKEIRDKQLLVNDLKNQLAVKEKQAMQRIKEIQEAKDKRKESENRKIKIEQEMSNLQEELQKTVALGGDWSGLLDEANSKVEETQKEVDRLKDMYKAKEKALQEAEKREKVLKSQKQTVAVQRRSQKSSEVSGQSEGEIPGMKQPGSSTFLSRKRSDSITAGQHSLLNSKKASHQTSDKTIKEEKSDRHSSDQLKSVYKAEKSQETMVNIVTKKKSSKAVDGEKVNAHIEDGKCSNCEAFIKIEDKEITKQKKEEILIQKFEQLLLGRQSKVFGNVIKDVTNRMQKIQKTESLSAHSNHTRSQERSQENNTSVNNAYMEAVQTPHDLSPMMQPRHDFNLQINHKLKTGASPIVTKPATSTPGAKNVVPREIPQGTQQKQEQHKSPEKVNKIVAFQQNSSLSSPEQTSPMQPKKNNSASVYRNMLNMTKQMSKNQNYRFALEDSELSKREEAIRSKRRGTGVNSNASRSPDFYRGSFRDSTVALSKSQQRSKAGFDLYPSFDQLRDSTVTREIATQTKFDPEDIQRIFIARIEQVLGMKGYRPVSTHGQPKLSVEGMHAQATRVATSQSAYRITWNKNSQVKNVANVEKMRKFEPIRRKGGRDKSDSVNPREKSDSQVTGVDESMQASFYTTQANHHRQGMMLTQNRVRNQIISGSMIQGQTFESRLEENHLLPRGAYMEVDSTNQENRIVESSASLKMQIKSFREHEKVLDNIVTQGDSGVNSRVNSVDSRKDTQN